MAAYYDKTKSHPLKADMLLVDIHQPQFTCEYAKEFQESMQRENAVQMSKLTTPGEGMYPNEKCLATQTEINERMRKVLVDWLIEVHINFKLLPETLFIAVNLIDRYCQIHQVERKNFQLLGVTSMLIAAKYEEIYPPYIKDFTFITDEAYTKEQMVDMEVKILYSLGFELTWPTSLLFLERYCRLSGIDDKLLYYSKYMLELSLIEVSMNKWCPSLLASSALYIAKKILQRPEPWSSFMTEQTKHSEHEVHKCAKDLCILLNYAHQKRHFQAIYKKYSQPNHYEVAQFCKSLTMS
jgi:hypothetical protein